MTLLLIAFFVAIHIICWFIGTYISWLHFGGKVDSLEFIALFAPIAPMSLIIAGIICYNTQSHHWNEYSDKSFVNFLKVGLI